MGVLRYAVGAGYSRFFEGVKAVSKSERKPAVFVLFKSIYCGIVYGSGLTDFFTYKLYKLSFRKIREYATIRDQERFYKIVSPEVYKKTFTVKPSFLRRFCDFVRRDFFDPTTDGPDCLAEFLQRNPVFMEKPAQGLAGQGVKKINSAEIESAESYFDYLKSNDMFVEGYIKQHPEMARLCPASVNTVRIITDSTGTEPKIVFAAMRIGTGKACVDNLYQGGMCAAVNIETGELSDTAYDKKQNEYKSHPVTGAVFKGFIVPNWDIVKSTVLRAALVEPRIMFIGWDVAVTPEGMTFVEGNRRPGFNVCQVALQTGCKYMMKNALCQLKERRKNEKHAKHAARHTPAPACKSK